MEHAAVAEAAVVSHPHPLKGECLYCFVTLREGHEFTKNLTDELKKQGSNSRILGSRQGEGGQVMEGLRACVLACGLENAAWTTATRCLLITENG